MRAGWRFLIYCVLWFVGMAVLGFATAPLTMNRLQTARVVFISGGCMFLAALGASVLLGKIEKRSPAEFGLPWRQAFGRRFWEGTVWGFGFLSAMMGFLHLTGNYNYGKPEIHGFAIIKYAVLWALAMLAVGLAEEYSFRGYPQFTLTIGLTFRRSNGAEFSGFWPSAILLSAIFGSVHRFNPGETWVGALNAGLIGFFFCLALRRTGSLWFPIGAHMAWNWGETFFYGVADSGMVSPGHLLNSNFQGSHWMTGGSVGPEGSVVTLFLVLLMCLVLHFRFPLKREDAGSGNETLETRN